MVIYRMADIYTGEIRETNSFKRIMEITINVLKERVHDEGGYNAHLLLIEKVVYDCDDSAGDENYWEYTALSVKTIATVFVSSLSVQITRLVDNARCIIWRDENK